MRIMRSSLARRWIALAGAALLLGCQSITTPPDEARVDPDAKIQELHSLWEIAPDHISACNCKEVRSQVPSRAAIRGQAEALLFRYPRHVPTLLFTSVMAYEAGEPHEAEKRLDDLLVIQPSHPEAAVLRSRIALEDGNSQFATRLLQDQIQMRPDHAGLREALAAAHFVTGDLPAAAMSLQVADQLGAPSWRVAYHEGVLAEAQGDEGRARERFEAALAGQPDWDLPRQRLEGLGFQPPVPMPGPAAVAAAPPALPTAVPPPPPPLPR